MKQKQIALTMFIFALSAHLWGQDLISRIDEHLAKGQLTVSTVLSDPAYMYLHSQTPFRELIKKHAKAGKLTTVTANEPGKKITVKAEVSDAHGRPVADALVYVYQTSDKGWYSDTAAHIQVNSGDMEHARLFAYFKTDATGGFEYETIQPKGYPNSDLPAHIHIAMWKDGKFIHGIPGELLFEDDPRLTPARKKSALEDGYLIAKSRGPEQHPVYFYKIVAD